MLTRRPAAALAAPFLLLLAGPVHAACGQHPFAHAKVSARALAQPARLVTLAGAVLAPFALAPTGADHAVRVWTQREMHGRYDLEATSLIAPYALASALAVSSLSTAVFDDCEGARVSNALLQSVLIAAIASSALKLTFGRVHPSGGGDPYAANRLDDASRAIRLDGPGKLGAWPSGHAAVTFAFASALRTTLPRAGVFRFAGYALAAGVSGFLILGDHHWTSDVVSGALLGEALGSAIGTGFGEPSRAGFALTPLPRGVALSGVF